MGSRNVLGIVIVTGSSGLVGRNLVRELLEINYKVIGFDIVETNCEKTKNNSNFKEVIVDICNRELLLEACKRYEKIHYVFHTVAIQPTSSNMDITQYLNINLVGSSNLIEVCNICGFNTVIASSSFSIYGKPVYLPIDESHPTAPMNPYGVSKLLSEMLFEFYSRTAKIHITILRYDGIYGNRQTIHGFVQYLMESLSANNDIELFHNGMQKRDHVFVDDVVQSNILAMKYNEKEVFSIFNIGGGDPKTSFETTNILKDILKSKSKTIKSKKTSPMGYDIYLDNNKADKLLGYKPNKLHKNIELMIEKATQ